MTWWTRLGFCSDILVYNTESPHPTPPPPNIERDFRRWVTAARYKGLIQRTFRIHSLAISAGLVHHSLFVSVDGSRYQASSIPERSPCHSWLHVWPKERKPQLLQTPPSLQGGSCVIRVLFGLPPIRWEFTVCQHLIKVHILMVTGLSGINTRYDLYYIVLTVWKLVSVGPGRNTVILKKRCQGDLHNTILYQADKIARK